ncbi:MAG: phage infection protein, partial [Atribacterota bacterium]|nr:phage infection protein [Atribacterota bacterium]
SDEPDFIKLTSLLHYKDDTESIHTTDILKIYNAIFSKDYTLQKDDKAIDVIFEQAKECLPLGECINLETKLILAIAIRLLSEKYMINEINDPTFVASIESNQTIKLIKKMKDIKPEDKNLPILEEVNLMTPENIHFNSFMYEPLIDISSVNLKELYKKVETL